MNKVLFIVGPTGVGKTDLAFKLAAKFDGELISADSIQVFKNLDIISGKDLPEGYKLKNGYYQRPNHPSIYLLDVVSPTLEFNVSKYFKEAVDAIAQIHKKGKLPIVVGGTGLYVEVLLKGLDATSKPDLKLRSELESLDILKLKKLIPKKKLLSLNVSDLNNKRRLIRLIEKLKNKKAKGKKLTTNFESLVIGLRCERDVLRQRIEKRVNERLKNGALDEAKKLFKKIPKLTQQVKDANGYRQLFWYFKGDIDLEEAIEKWKISEYRHAKNQMTWFQKYGGVKWFDSASKGFKKEIEAEVKKFL